MGGMCDGYETCILESKIIDGEKVYLQIPKGFERCYISGSVDKLHHTI
jgi:hypothetical protein